jgi:F-type H+-transporting ATPase subunit b
MSSIVRVSLVLAEEGKEEFQSHHPWWPELKEITWGGLAILIVYALLAKFLIPAAKKGLAARTERIANEINAAATDRKEAEAAASAARARLADVDASAARIVEQARADAAQMRGELSTRTEQILVDTRTAAEAELVTMGSRAGAEVQASVARLSLGAAERVVTANLDATTQDALIEDFIAAVGRSNGSGS